MRLRYEIPNEGCITIHDGQVRLNGGALICHGNVRIFDGRRKSYLSHAFVEAGTIYASHYSIEKGFSGGLSAMVDVHDLW